MELVAVHFDGEATIRERKVDNGDEATVLIDDRVLRDRVSEPRVAQQGRHPCLGHTRRRISLQPDIDHWAKDADAVATLARHSHQCVSHVTGRGDASPESAVQRSLDCSGVRDRSKVDQGSCHGRHRNEVDVGDPPSLKVCQAMDRDALHLGRAPPSRGHLDRCLAVVQQSEGDRSGTMRHRSLGTDREACREQRLLTNLRRAPNPEDAGMHATPKPALDSVADLAPAQPELDRLRTTDESMLDAGKFGNIEMTAHGSPVRPGFSAR